MGEVIDFPVRAQTATTADVPFEDDPYFRFIHNVLHTANAYGFELPFSIDSAAEHVYQQTREKSQLAKMLAQVDEDL